MEAVIILEPDETAASLKLSEEGKKNYSLLALMEKMEAAVGYYPTILGCYVEGDAPYDLCLTFTDVVGCLHENTCINDRMQTVCSDCGLELGR
jgi:hypothetical protein